MRTDRRLTDEECWRLLLHLFPRGLEDPLLLQELAPEGWEQSPLRLVFHPTVDQMYDEVVRIHTNIQELLAARGRAGATPPPSLEEIRREYRAEPSQPRTECGDLVGLCLWDVFSDNHDVFTPQGLLVDLGSFRGSAGFIADFRKTGGESGGGCRETWDYLDFYMGTALVGHRADLAPVYELIFRRMKPMGLDWRYVHPRLYLVELGGLADLQEDSDKPEWLGYDPSQAIAREQERRQRRQATAELRDLLDKDYQESAEQARRNPAPRTVQAYRHVYGRWPDGWPP